MIDRINFSHLVCIRLLSLLLTLVSSAQLLMGSWWHNDTNRNMNFVVVHRPVSSLHSFNDTTNYIPTIATITTTTTKRKSPNHLQQSITSDGEPPSLVAPDDDDDNDAAVLSRVTTVSSGMVRYDNVCLYSKETTTIQQQQKDGYKVIQKRRQLRIQSFGNDPLRVNDDIYQAYYPNPGNYKVFLQTDLVNQTSVHDIVDWIPEPTLFALQLHHNPGHCLSDMVFSIALDAWERRGNKDQKNTNNITTHSPYPFDKFVYGTWNKVWYKAYQPDWCFEFLRTAQMIPAQYHRRGGGGGAMVRPPIDFGHVCFRQLYVPVFGLHRFPLDISSVANQSWVQAFRNVSVMQHFWTNNFTIPYPVQALEALRETLCNSLQVPCTPWSIQQQQENVVVREPQILLYNREGSPRRHWKNADQVQALLQQRYQVHVTMLGREWEDMNLTQQLTLYNAQAYIVTVHGAHQANLIAARAGTHVMEIQCLHPQDPRPDPTLQSQPTVVKDDTTVAWYGPPSWFSAFSRRLGAEHFVYGEYAGCTSSTGQRGIHRSTDVNVTDVDGFVTFVAGRFGLRPRATRGTLEKQN